MGTQRVNIGTNPDDGTGDNVREAFTKVNLAMDETDRKMPMLDKDNPVMPLHVSAAGHMAQMQVVDDETNHEVAIMEWLKSSQQFIFNLFDRVSGVSLATFQIKSNGKAYVEGREIMTSPLRASIHRHLHVDVDADDSAYVIFPFDEIVEEDGCDVDLTANSITVEEDGKYDVSRGVIAAFSGTEEMALMVFINDLPYSGYPLTVHGRANSKPISVFWVDEIQLNKDDIVTLRVKNFDAGNVSFHVKRAILQVRKVA